MMGAQKAQTLGTPSMEVLGVFGGMSGDDGF